MYTTYSYCAARRKLNGVTKYKLVDFQGNSVILESSELKRHMKMGTINVVNLTLTSDGKLREKLTTVFGENTFLYMDSASYDYPPKESNKSNNF